MLRKTLPLLAIGALALSTACYKVDYTTSTSESREADHEIWRHRIVYGIVELDGPVEVKDLCTNGEFSKIHTEVDIVTGLVGWLVNSAASTVGIGLAAPYTPGMVYVWCEDGTAYRATVDQDNTVLALEAPVDQEIPSELGVMSEECAEPGL